MNGHRYETFILEFDVLFGATFLTNSNAHRSIEIGARFIWIGGQNKIFTFIICQRIRNVVYIIMMRNQFAIEFINMAKSNLNIPVCLRQFSYFRIQSFVNVLNSTRFWYTCVAQTGEYCFVHPLHTVGSTGDVAVAQATATIVTATFLKRLIK